MAPIDPSLASVDEQPGPQTTSRSSTGFNKIQTQVAWNSSQMSNIPMDSTRMLTMPSLTSQNAFIPSIPTVSATSSFDPLANTTWPDSGAFLTQRIPTNPGSGRDSTRQAANPRGPVSENDSGKRSRQHPACDMNNTFEPIHPYRHPRPLPEGVPNKTRPLPPGGWDGDGSNQVMSRTGLNPSERTPWPGESTAERPGDDPDGRATACPGQRTDPSGGGTTTTSSSSPASSARPRQTQDLRARNRRAATKCRAKAKAAVAELEATEREMESRHQELSAQATRLQDEVLALKNELLLHGNCDCEPIQRYLTNAAKNIIGGRVA